MKFNPVLSTDAYKITHWLQRPEGVSKLYSYGEARGGQHDVICFFGLQYIVKEYMMRVVTQEDIDEGYEESLSCFGFNHYFPKEIWQKVKDLGYFPIEIKAVKEGTVLPTSNVCFTIESTEEWFANMVSHFEDWLMWCWYSSGVATRAFHMKKEYKKSFEKSGDDFMDFAVNDFGYRGAMFHEAACIGGAASLIFSNGTDNMAARKLIKDYYITMGVGQSIWATEHSVATVWGPGRGEFDYVIAQLSRAGDKANLAIVIDSYDADNFISNVIGSDEIRPIVMEREGRTILRPDSGVPEKNVLKYLAMLGNIFGYHYNGKGLKVINYNVGIIQGDGMNEDSIPELFKVAVLNEWSTENLSTGSGGGLLVEGLTRDTDSWAIKVAYAEIDGKPRDVRKTPKTDMTKQSKGGRLKLHKSGECFTTLQSSKEEPNQFKAYTDALETVYKNGELVREQSFAEIQLIGNSYL